MGAWWVLFELLSMHFFCHLIHFPKKCFIMFIQNELNSFVKVKLLFNQYTFKRHNFSSKSHRSILSLFLFLIEPLFTFSEISLHFVNFFPQLPVFEASMLLVIFEIEYLLTLWALDFLLIHFFYFYAFQFLKTFLWSAMGAYLCLFKCFLVATITHCRATLFAFPGFDQDATAYIALEGFRYFSLFANVGI